MRDHLRNNLVGYLVLFLLFTSGTAKAIDGPLPGQNTIGSEDIIGNEVKSDDIGNGRIFNLDIADNVIQGGKIKNGTLSGAEVASNNLIGADISEPTLFNDNSLTTTDINESTLFNGPDLAVSLDAADLATNSVGTSEIAMGAVGKSEVIDQSLTAADIGTGEVSHPEIAADSVRASELATVTEVRDTITVAPGTEDVAQANCPTGQVAIGGTALIEEFIAGGPRTLASFPVIASGVSPAAGEQFVGWRGVFFNGDTIELTAQAEAFCLEGP